MKNSEPIPPRAQGLSFDERFGLLVDCELTWRDNRKLARLLREARLKSSQACVEDVRYGNGRRLDKSMIAQLATCQWIRNHQRSDPHRRDRLRQNMARLCAGQWHAPPGVVESSMSERRGCSKSCALPMATAASPGV